MPRNMMDYGFPCSESNCYTSATMEFTMLTLISEFKLPLCKQHADELAQDARISSV
jgi:hypothetical protein